MKSEIVTIKTTTPWIPMTCPRWIRYVEFIIRTKIFRQQRYLIDDWTTEEPEGLTSMHGIDIEQELADILREEINQALILEHGEDWQQQVDDAIIAELRKIKIKKENDNE